MRKSKEKATYDLLCQLDVGEPDGKEEKMNQLKFTISLKPLRCEILMRCEIPCEILCTN